MFLGLEEPRLPDVTLPRSNTLAGSSASHSLSLLLTSYCLRVECAKTAVISAIWSPRGCEKYGKHQNRLSTPGRGISEDGFVIHGCFCCYLSEVCRVFERLNDFMLQLSAEEIREAIMINLLSLWRHKQTMQAFQLAGLRGDGAAR